MTHSFPQKIAKIASSLHHSVCIERTYAAVCVLGTLKKNFGRSSSSKVSRILMSIKRTFFRFFSWIFKKSYSIMENLTQVNFFRTGSTTASQYKILHFRRYCAAFRASPPQQKLIIEGI